MIRTFRLYRLTKMQKMAVAEAKERLKKVRLATISDGASPRLSRLLGDLADSLQNERLDGPRPRPGHWEMTLHGKWPARRITVAPGPLPRIPVEVMIWLRRVSGWLVVFEASRALGDAGVYLAAQALANDVCAVAHLSLEQAHWLAIAGWLTKQGGDLLGGRFYKTKAGGTELESITLRRAPHSDPALLRESFENAQGIGELLLETPEIEAAGGGLKCRIGRSGNIRVYGSQITDPMIDSLLGELEELWENVPTESKG